MLLLLLNPVPFINTFIPPLYALFNTKVTENVRKKLYVPVGILLNVLSPVTPTLLPIINGSNFLIELVSCNDNRVDVGESVDAFICNGVVTLFVMAN